MWSLVIDHALLDGGTTPIHMYGQHYGLSVAKHKRNEVGRGNLGGFGGDSRT